MLLNIGWRQRHLRVNMPPDPVTAMARKWCPVHGPNQFDMRAICICAPIAAAVREALEKVERMVDNMDYPDVVRAIAALRGGTG